ncbi:MAG: hypothetical protein KC900_10890 [Candidatus Omnitrophica bacterium]|nr:hypothetical protein [Candidatus Omnitrophota bacterium]
MNFLFYADIDDLTTPLKPTQSCYPGGTCRDVGMEPWGGQGTLLLSAVNLMQGLLVFDVLFGIYLLVFKLRTKGALT